MNTMKMLAAAAGFALTVALAGCGSSSSHDMGPMSTPASPSAPTTSSAGTPAQGPHNDADVTFAQLMTPHHRQAIEMADMILAKQGIDPQVTTLATEIKAAQTPEIDQMTGWLTGWGQGAGPSTTMDHDMGGTMSRSAMDALDKATGDEATKLFLSGMIGHHQGAIDMATDELANGENPSAKALARSIEDSQQIEIDTMNELLKKY